MGAILDRLDREAIAANEGLSLEEQTERDDAASDALKAAYMDLGAGDESIAVTEEMLRAANEEYVRWAYAEEVGELAMNDHCLTRIYRLMFALAPKTEDRGS